MRGTGAALLGAALFLGAGAWAQDVTLNARGGGLSVSGVLLGYDGAFYRIESPYGELTLDADGVTCTGPGCPDPATFVPEVRFSGAPEIGRVLLPALIEAFAERRQMAARREDNPDGSYGYELAAAGKPALRMTVTPTSSDEGFADLLTNAADVALSNRPPTADEVARGLEGGLGDLSAPARGQVIALDAVVAIVARANPLQQISPDRLVAVLAGDLRDWGELGAPPGPIHLHLPTADHPLRAVLGRPAFDPAPTWGTVDLSGRALADAVAGDPLALGVTRFSEIGLARAVPLAGRCGFRSAAGQLGIKTRDYPLTTPLSLYWPARRQGPVLRDFLAFVLSPEAQPVIRRAGFVDQGLVDIPIESQGRRLANAIRQAGRDVSLSSLQILVAALEGGNRLTATFRFDDGSPTLDAQSRTSVILLAQALRKGVLDGSRIAFLGFSDGTGDAAGNARLARARADAALAAVLDFAPDLGARPLQFSTASFGESLPILCDADPWGARVNRRVEVWRYPLDR